MADSEIDDHLLQCPKRSRHQNEIYQVIKRLGKEMDPVLLEILLDGVTKYLTGTRQTKYIVGSSRKQQTDYWDRIRQVTGQETTTNKEHELNFLLIEAKSETVFNKYFCIYLSFISYKLHKNKITPTLR